MPEIHKSFSLALAFYFYVATKRLMGGDKAAARDYFEKCLATGQSDHGEFCSAAAELKYLRNAQ